MAFKVKHEVEHEDLMNKDVDQQGKLLEDSVIARSSSLTRRNQTDPYPRNHTLQKSFEKKLLEFIVLDCVPLNILQGSGFNRMIKMFDARLRIPHRKTIGTLLEKKSKMVHIEMTKN